MPWSHWQTHSSMSLTTSRRKSSRISRCSPWALWSWFPRAYVKGLSKSDSKIMTSCPPPPSCPLRLTLSFLLPTLARAGRRSAAARPARDTRAPRVTFAISLCCCGNPGGSSLFGVRLKERRFVGCTYPLATAEGAQDEGTLTFDSHGAAVCNAS